LFVGHSLLAFALVTLAASRAFDVDARRALVLGAVAGAFAAVPDADMAYALSGVVDATVALAASNTAGVAGDGVFAVTGAFWAASTVVHRSMTHSLVVAPVAALAFALLAHRGRGVRPAAFAGAMILVGLAAVATVLHGMLGLVVLAAFAGAGIAVAIVVRAWTDLDARATSTLAFVGLGSHPFGDLFTGDPPALLWPLDATVLDARVALAADPTIHLLAAFALELAVVALALVVYADLAGHDLRVAPQATAGLVYGAAVLVVPAPTLDVSYQFVFSILALGVLTTTPGVATVVRDALDGLAPRTLADGGRIQRVDSPRRVDRDRVVQALATGIATVAFALVAYAAGYLVVA
jgi:membrane-bound metal-dependent hydrolase YbcI (DUF457 family)